LIGDGGLVVHVADPLEVIEQVMRYFYGLGVHGAKSKAPVDQVQKCFQKALYAAGVAAPYRHARLSAVKHIDNAETIDGISANEIAKRVAMLRDLGMVDLEALPPPAAESERGVDDAVDTMNDEAVDDDECQLVPRLTRRRAIP
jgi:hypothetical protein